MKTAELIPAFRAFLFVVEVRGLLGTAELAAMASLPILKVIAAEADQEVEAAVYQDARPHAAYVPSDFPATSRLAKALDVEREFLSTDARRRILILAGRWIEAVKGDSR